jgi:hypothetical protein
LTVEKGYGTINSGGVNGVVAIGKIKAELFENVGLILTDEVIITEKQIEHVKERHPRDYELYADYMSEIIASPDYILYDDLPNTALLLKSFYNDGENFQLVLRFKSAQDPETFKNSIITFMKINRKRYEQYVKNKKILYKRE